MNRIYTIGLGALALLGWVATGRAGYIDHNFDAAPFTNGATFVTALEQWQASTDSVVVATGNAWSAPHSILVPRGSELSNVVAATSPSVVWTDVRVAPCLGDPPPFSATNGVATVQYFGTNGCLHVWTNGGWLACSNDVWGQTVAKVTNGVFADVSICQNFSNQTVAILLNDQVVIQDLPFLGAFANYGSFRMTGASGDAWLDDAYIQATYATARLTNNLNGIDGADAAELQTYGYVARTMYVGVGPGYPGFATIQAALNVWRPRDLFYVYGGLYVEDVTVTNSVTFSGQSFTNSGSLTIGPGVTVAFQGGTVWSNVTIGANAVVTFNQSLTCSNLSVAANATVTFGGAVNLGSATVLGAVVVSGAGTVTVATVLSVPTNGTGHLDFSGGRLWVPLSGVDMTGTFSITNNWDTQARVRLDFIDDFELYAADSQVANLGFRGWGVSSTGVLVQATQGTGGSQGVVVPDSSVLSNRITSTGQPKIWTDFAVKPVLGEAPTTVNTNSYTFLSYVGTNGLLNVWNAGAWMVCSNSLDGSNVMAMAVGSYTRVTVFLNFDSHRAAVFVGGKIVCQQLPFPAGAAIPSYGSFRAQSPKGSAYLDNVRITSGIATGLTADLDNDGMLDAQEIQTYDSLSVWKGAPGTSFKFR